MYGNHSLAGVVADIERHRHRMARLLDGLDGLERAVDADTLVHYLVGRLRLDDLQLRQLAAELDQKTSPISHDPAPKENTHAHAIRPLP